MSSDHELNKAYDILSRNYKIDNAYDNYVHGLFQINDKVEYVKRSIEEDIRAYLQNNLITKRHYPVDKVYVTYDLAPGIGYEELEAGHEIDVVTGEIVA